MFVCTQEWLMSNAYTEEWLMFVANVCTKEWLMLSNVCG